MIRPLVDFLIDKGVAGIYPLGSTGEGPLFTTDERKAVAAATVEAVARRVPNLDRPRHPVLRVKLIWHSIQRSRLQFATVLDQHFVGTLLSHGQCLFWRLFAGIDRFNRLGD